jgi:hypothetical protein
MIDPRRAGIRRGLPATCFLLTLIALLPLPAAAQLSASPYLDARVEHDSNVFRVPNSEPLIIANGDPTLADWDQKYTAGLNATYLWSQQKLTALLEVRKQDFEHFKDLNHYEYLADIGLDWKLTSLVDGLLEYRQEKYMAPFYLGDSLNLALDVDRRVVGKANINVAADWRIETGLSYRYLQAPLQFYPDFDQREFDTHLALDYLGAAYFTYGIAYDFISGAFDNAPNVGNYTQNGLGLTAKYAVSALTTLNAQLGYSIRDQTNTGTSRVSEITGELKYTRQLTGKTSVNLDLSRNVNSYLAGGASEVDTVISAGALWQATYKIGVDLNAGYTHSSFVGQAIPGSNVDGRVDHFPTQSIDLKYQMLRHLWVKAYFNHSARSSTYELYNFSDTIAGIEARWTFNP